MTLRTPNEPSIDQILLGQKGSRGHSHGKVSTAHIPILPYWGVCKTNHYKRIVSVESTRLMVNGTCITSSLLVRMEITTYIQLVLRVILSLHSDFSKSIPCISESPKGGYGMCSTASKGTWALPPALTPLGHWLSTVGLQACPPGTQSFAQ